jgi:hypothetical protein
MNRPRTIRALRLPAAAVLLAAAALGCREATAPEPDAPASPYAFVPADSAVTVAPGGWLDFRVVGPADRAPEVRWLRPGADGALGERFRFFAAEAPRETLQATVREDGALAAVRRWAVHVTPPGDPRVDFAPADSVVTAYATLPTRFRASSPWPLGPVTWTIDGAAAGSDTVLVFEAREAGERTVAAEAEVEGSAHRRRWRVDVRPFAEAAPPAIAGLTIMAGNEPGAAVLEWPAVSGSILPIVAYEVRCRVGGPPTAATWDSDTDPGDRTAYDGVTRYRVDYAPGDLGAASGDVVWLAVRARDERGLRSPVVEAVSQRLPEEWWIEGAIVGHDGAPLAGIPVEDTNHVAVAATGEDGRYVIGPYFEMDPVVLEAGNRAGQGEGGWHVARSDTLRFAGGRRQDFLLLPRLPIAPNCFAFGDNFQAYLRLMTKTVHPSANRPDVRLHHWPAYPVTVHVPDWVSPAGVDYGACAREAVAIWNRNLGVTAFTLVDDLDQAQVSIRYDLEDAAAYGLLELDEPGGGDLVIGEATPERISARVTPDAAAAQPVTEILLHELGHGLGLHNHATCGWVPYLMYISSLGSLDNGPDNAIHPDELNAVRTIMLLPDGLDMSVYPMDEP